MTEKGKARINSQIEPVERIPVHGVCIVDGDAGDVPVGKCYPACFEERPGYGIPEHVGCAASQCIAVEIGIPVDKLTEAVICITISELNAQGVKRLPGTLDFDAIMVCPSCI